MKSIHKDIEYYLVSAFTTTCTSTAGTLLLKMFNLTKCLRFSVSCSQAVQHINQFFFFYCRILNFLKIQNKVPICDSNINKNVEI